MVVDEQPTDLGSLAADLRELAAAPAELLLRGTRVDDQYEIERVIGQGAMGVVYLARDLRLERNVAIKIARGASPVALARASREAVALARLSHPNVVVVHQVGVLEGRVYVAMEHVAGTTARAWCQTHAAREILALYVAVGEGLAAAHARGLVHRDFKPDNVLVGEDGRGRVADFGLATSEPIPDDVAGTPAYMPPEQVRGEELDARADQYAFCASLAEALAGRKIPRHADAAIKRGLAPSRDARWPSLPPLLAELRRDPARARRRVAVGAVVPAIAVAAFALATRGGAAAADPCAAGTQAMAARWSAERRGQVRAAVAPAGAPAWIAATATAAIATTDAWTGRWATSYRGVCEAGWSPVLHDRGMECLARGEHALGATLDSLVEAGVDASRVDDLLAHLPRPEACADPVYLGAIVPPPTDPALARAVGDAQDQLQRASVLVAAGQDARAGALLGELEHRPALGYAPLAAQLHFARGAHDRVTTTVKTAVPELQDAYFEARTAGDRVTAARAASEATVALIDSSQDLEAHQWARLAEAEVATIADPVLQAMTLRALSIVATARNEPQRGLELADRELRIERGLGNPHAISHALMLRSQAADALGSYTPALADLDEAGRMLVGAYGDGHPDLCDVEEQRSLVLIHLGRDADAVVAARHALAVAEATNAPNGPSVITATGTLGMALSHAHQRPESLELLGRSIALTTAAEGEQSYNVASDYNNRCDLLTQMQRYDEAIADCQRAIRIWTAVIGKDAHENGLAEYNTTLALLAAERFEEARAAAGRAIALLGQQADSPQVALAWTARAKADLHSNRRDEARQDLERAIARLEAKASDPAWLADARLELARLERQQGHLAAARALARAARDGFRTLGDGRLPAAEQLVAALGDTP